MDNYTLYNTIALHSWSFIFHHSSALNMAHIFYLRHINGLGGVVWPFNFDKRHMMELCLEMETMTALPV